MESWLKAGRDIEYIYNVMLELHTSVLNNKSSAIPPEWWPATEKFMKRVGYRLVTRLIRHEKWLEPGNTMTIEMIMDNIGVAPPYRSYIPVFEIRAAGGRRDKNVLINKFTDWPVKRAFPGRHRMSTEIIIPDDAKPGRYLVYFALLDPYTKQPAIKLAVSGGDAQNWYSWTTIEVVEKGTLQEVLTQTKD